MDLTIQIVNFRSRHYLKKCLFSIAKNLSTKVRAEIVVINNDAAPLGLPSVVEIGKNVGFGKAHNIGFQQSRGKYILFLNPDTEILPGAIERMLTTLEENPKMGIAGPLLIDSQGELQPDCFGSNRTPLTIAGKKIFSQKRCEQLKDANVLEVDWVSGGAMMVRRDVFARVGGFDENYFMYFEDVDFCLRARELGYKAAINPMARIFHESGRSFESESQKKKLYYASQDYYLQKHFGSSWASLVKLLRLPYYIRNVYLGR